MRIGEIILLHYIVILNNIKKWINKIGTFIIDSLCTIEDATGKKYQCQILFPLCLSEKMQKNL